MEMMGKSFHSKVIREVDAREEKESNLQDKNQSTWTLMDNF